MSKDGRLPALVHRVEAPAPTLHVQFWRTIAWYWLKRSKHEKIAKGGF